MEKLPMNSGCQRLVQGGAKFEIVILNQGDGLAVQNPEPNPSPCFVASLRQYKEF
jgi:hypothetical protein